MLITLRWVVFSSFIKRPLNNLVGLEDKQVTSTIATYGTFNDNEIETENIKISIWGFGDDYVFHRVHDDHVRFPWKTWKHRPSVFSIVGLLRSEYPWSCAKA